MANYILPAGNSSIIWYRLKITDKDGKTSYSNIVKVNANNQELQTMKLYPNPGFKSIHLIGTSGYGSITIINNVGMTVQQKQLAQIIWLIYQVCFRDFIILSFMMAIKE